MELILKKHVILKGKKQIEKASPNNYVCDAPISGYDDGGDCACFIIENKIDLAETQRKLTTLCKTQPLLEDMK